MILHFNFNFMLSIGFDLVAIYNICFIAGRILNQCQAHMIHLLLHKSLMTGGKLVQAK
jgi:hypothetical protein